MNKTTITTDYSRELTVQNRGYEFNLGVKDTDGTYAVKGEVYAHLYPEQATQLGLALLGENATVITDLPEVTLDGDGWPTADDYYHNPSSNLDHLLQNAKALLAIHAFLVKHNAEQEAAKKAEAEAEAEAAKAKEAARDYRRDELATELRGFGDYAGSSDIFRKAIDRIIELEEAAKVS